MNDLNKPYDYLIEGSNVWYANAKCKGIDSDDKPYLIGCISDVNKTNCTIGIKDSLQRIEFHSTLPYVYNNESINENDLLNLNDASQIDILNNIRNRLLSSSHITCTYLGPILLMANPYAKNEAFYSLNTLNQLIINSLNNTNSNDTQSNEPHLYEVVIKAIKKLLSIKSNQMIIFSGESGAGKTEATNNSLQCILYYFNRSNEIEAVLQLQNQISSCNVILEAFGNAKTMQNSNSSRFTKSLSISINISNESIYGMMIKTMLLEKARVCDVSVEERSFHIFYQLLSCGDTELLSSLYLFDDITHYELLRKSNCFAIKGVNDKEAFKETIRCLDINNFSKDEIDTILKIVAAVLLLGNLRFTQESNKGIVISNRDVLERISELLQSKDEDIAKAFTVNINKISGVEYSKPVKDVADARELCNVFAEDIYNRLFNFIVMRLNTTVNPNGKANANNNDGNFIEDIKEITLIDIFGFENCKNNSLEQLCINYTNELLQQYFLKYFYENEISEYKEDGLNDLADKITYPINKEILDGFETDNKSIFHLIKESTFNAQNSIKFFDNLQKVIGKSHKLIQFPRNVSKGSFQIIHPSQTVVYNSALMLLKNKDEVKNSLIEIIEKSKSITLKQIYLMDDIPNKEVMQSEFEEMKKVDTYKKNKSYLIDKYIEKLKGLMKNVIETESHYIRCLKPNMAQKDYNVNESYLLNQIKYYGIAEGIKFKAEGYPIRLVYYDFFKHFDLIFPEMQNITTVQSENCKLLPMKIIETLTPEYYSNPQDPPLYVFGTKKIFLKQRFMTLLKERMEDKLKNKVIALQVLKVGIIYIKKKYKSNAYRSNIKAIQVCYKTHQSRSKIASKLRTICLIQSAFITKRIERNFNVLVNQYLILQPFLKTRAACLKIEQKIEVIKLLAYRMHIYMKQITQRRRNKMKRITHDLIYKSIEVIAVGEYYILWKKIHPFFVSCIVRRKYATIAFIAKKERFKGNKVYVYQAFHSNNFLFKIQQKARSAKGIRFFVLTNISLNYFLILRNNIMIIQEYAKRYYMKKQVLTKQIEKCFRENEDINNDDVLSYEKTLFPYSLYNQQQQQQQQQQQSMQSISNKGTNMVFSSRLASFNDKVGHCYNNNRKHYLEREQSNKELNANANAILPEIEMYNEEKIKLFSHLLDIDIMTDISEIYENSWAEEYRKVIKLNMEKKTPIQMIYTSESHTVVLNSKGKMYSWGWNNYGQCCSNIIETTKNGILPSFESNANSTFPFLLPLVNYKPSAIPVYDNKEIGKISHIACGTEYTFILNDNGRVFCLGQNNKGQLGFGNCALLPTPRVLSCLDGKVKDIKTTENMTVVLTTESEVFMWYSIKEYDAFPPSQLYLNPKIKITQLSCGCNFLMLLTLNGIVYAMGTNARGELGLQDTEAREGPEEVVGLSEYKEKIISIKCGYKHTICLSSIGRVYSWGVNSNGQLGKEDQMNNHMPQLVQIDLKTGNFPMKTLHIAAGFRSSFFLMENRAIYYCGIISNRNTLVYKPVQFRIDLKSPEISSENGFCPIRILASWNKSFSLFYATIADMRQISNKISHNQMNRIYKTLATKWTNERISCPYIESMATYFNASFMKKPNYS